MFLAAPEEALARLVFVSYPVADIGLVTVVMVLLLRSRGRVSPWLLVLGAAFVSYSVADSAYGLASARNDFQIGTPLDLGWTGGYLLLAVAAVSAGWARDQRPNAEITRARQAFSGIGDLLIFAIVTVTIVAGDIPGVPARLVRTQQPDVALVHADHPTIADETLVLIGDLDQCEPSVRT